MAVGSSHRPCTIVLHDDHVSTRAVLAGTDVLPVGSTAYLSTTSKPALLILSEGRAAGQKEVSLHARLATRYGFNNRSTGRISLVEDEDRITATHVDLVFQDEGLSRPDMWRLARQLDGTVLYKGTSLSYLGHAAAKVEAIYLEGAETTSALFLQGKTKPILRSGSARYTIIVQISREMLEEWCDGDLMYERLIEGYFKELFQRWEHDKARHEVSVVLFGRTAAGERQQSEDLFQVLHINTPSNQWRTIIRALKIAFNTMDLPQPISTAFTGNMLEALHLTALGYLLDDEAVHLCKPYTSIIAVTAGQGVFQADYDLLKKTTQLLLGNNIGLDIVSLSTKPRHPVPLFSYQLGEREEYALPHWADISYWPPGMNDSIGSSAAVITISEGHISLPYLPGNNSVHEQIDVAANHDKYDEDCFSITESDRLLEDLIQAVPPHTSNKAGQTTDTSSSPNHTRLEPAPPLKQRPSTSSIATTISLNKHNKSQNAIGLSNRKISVGPRGLAPLKSGASTTISTLHANHGKDLTAIPSKFVPNEAASGLTKQIRASLNRQRSQSSLSSHVTAIIDHPTQPIDIRTMTATEEDTGPPDEVGHTLRPSSASSSMSRLKQSTSKTPKAFDGLTSSPRKPSVDPGLDALTPWLTLINPCNLARENMRVALQYRQWQHVFPKAINSADFKWRSMCSPAALPLYIDLYPSAEELKKHYRRTTRRIVCSSPDGVGRTSHEVLSQLVAMRLSHGFQLVSRHIDKQHVFMSFGADYHELQCLSHLELEIIEYTHSISEPLIQHSTELHPYKIQVKPLFSSYYHPTIAHFENTNSNLDWSSIDQMVDSNDPSDSLFRMRFVLLPVEPHRGDSTGHLGAVGQKELADDERRIDGIQRLTQQWQRHRVFSAEDQSHQVSFVRRNNARTAEEVDHNPLAIEYHTRDPSTLINSQEAHISQVGGKDIHVPLFSESERFHSRNFDIVKLVKQMQEDPPHGVEVRDRRWFARIHLRCFRGDEMVNWLLGAFKDLHSREDAVELGNELMNREIFTHVRYKHPFRDGNYFYQIGAAHRTTEYPNAIASVFNRGPSRSIPPTPSSEVRMSPQIRPLRSDAESATSDSIAAADKRQFMLTQMLMYNVDPERRSEQDETINLHYDRIHNPENCYHIYIDWRFASPILVQDAINRWTKLTSPYGLRLVQVPLLQASEHSERYPLQHPQYVKLAMDPPDRVPSTPQSGSLAPSPKFVDDRKHYHKLILRKLGFVLDIESVDSYSDKIEVVVSACNMDYTMTQFIHRTGLLLAQISNNRKWDFLLLPNTLIENNNVRGKPIESTASIIESVRTLAEDRRALKVLYDDASKPRLAGPSPFARAVLANADMDVPPISLPPRILGRGV